MGNKKNTDLEELRLENLEIIEKLQKAEIGNYERLEKIKKVLGTSKLLSEDNLRYLREKYQQLTFVDEKEGKINRAFQYLKKLEDAEIGNPKRLQSIRNVLRTGSLLSEDDDDYFQDKLDQLEKIEPGLQKNFSEKTQDSTQFWVCPNCGNDTQMKDGRQYCPSCKIYLSI